jgi:hypothetical protein
MLDLTPLRNAAVFVALVVTFVLSLMLVLIGYGIGVRVERTRFAEAKAEWAKQGEGQALDALGATVTLRAKEQALANASAKVGVQYQESKDDAKAKADKVVADLVSGHTRLRNELAGCEAARGNEAAASRRELDEAAAVRAQIAGSIVRVGADCDAHVAALQRQLTLERETAP